MYTAMTGAEAAAADILDLDEVEDIELDQATDRDSESLVPPLDQNARVVVRSIQLGTALKQWLIQLLVLATKHNHKEPVIK